MKAISHLPSPISATRSGAQIRDQNFEQLRERLAGLRGVVYSALRQHGPCTTRQLAARSGLDILTVRPRVTELLSLDFAECVDRADNEGVYRALSHDEARVRIAEREAIARGEGVQMALL